MPAVKRRTLLDAATTTGAGPIAAVGEVENPTVHVEGMVSGDIVQIEGSNDDPRVDTPNWQQVGDDITEDGIYAIEAGVGMLRANLTDVTGGGTITAILNGRIGR